MSSVSDIETAAREIERLRAQLAAKTRVATRALATYQQRTLKMEEHAADLRAANAEVRRVNESLSKALAVLEERERIINDDLAQAQRFQQRILPEPPITDRVDFAVAYRPAQRVGGDVYDIWQSAPHTHRVFMADATGHGVQAAMRTMLLKAEYDRIKGDVETPEDALIALNHKIGLVYPGLELHCTAACFDLTVEPDGRAQLRYATAAHPPLLHLSNGKLESIYQPGPFVGVVPHIELEPVEVTLEPGDRLLLFTDGLAEQWDAEGRELGMRAIEAAFSNRSLSIARVVDRIVDEWKAFLGEQRPADDATLIAIQTTSEPNEH